MAEPDLPMPGAVLSLVWGLRRGRRPPSWAHQGPAPFTRHHPSAIDFRKPSAYTIPVLANLLRKYIGDISPATVGSNTMSKIWWLVVSLGLTAPLPLSPAIAFGTACRIAKVRYVVTTGAAGLAGGAQAESVWKASVLRTASWSPHWVAAMETSWFDAWTGGPTLANAVHLGLAVGARNGAGTLAERKEARPLMAWRPRSARSPVPVSA